MQPVSGNLPSGNRPQNVYNLHVTPAAPAGPAGPPRGGFGRHAAAENLSIGVQYVSVPRPVPQFMGNSSVIVMAWMVAMAVVAFDEWKRHHIFPRPARLWWTTAVYGILALTGMVPALLPLMNALAIGYTIMLLWQYFTKNGQFTEGSKAGE